MDDNNYSGQDRKYADAGSGCHFRVIVSALLRLYEEGQD
jgi:hypothetical protein